ncbi:MAG: acetyltransferase, ribosomal protein N-acetylase [Firmicutes bacterium]|nr:acetyltransferase, ribosomal protein N-acetylase [Bacillota bacterium]
MGGNGFIFETERLIVRRYQTDDATDLLKVLNDKDVTKYIPETIVSFDEALNAVSWLISNYDKQFDEHFKYSYAITLKECDKYIGWCGFGVLDFDKSKKEIYYTISRKYWGKGYAGEAVRGLIEYIFDIYDIDKLVALVKTENTASKKIIEKNGFNFVEVIEGLSKEYDFYEGELYYELERKRREVSA